MKRILFAAIALLSSATSRAEITIESMRFFDSAIGLNQEAMVCSPLDLRFYNHVGDVGFSTDPLPVTITLLPGMLAFNNSDCSGTPNPMNQPQVVPPLSTHFAFWVRSYSPIAAWLNATATGGIGEMRASIWINIYHIPVKGISFRQTLSSQAVGPCMAFPFEFVGEKGTPVVVRDAHRVALTKPNAPQSNVFSDRSCRIPFQEVIVQPGQRGVTLYSRLENESTVPVMMEDSEYGLIGATSLVFDGIGYKDVGVIINRASDVSMRIGHYFARKRGIPQANIFYVDTVLGEIINSSKFNSIRSQLEAQLLVQDPLRKLNYLVTTKGMPLAVERDDHNSTGSTSASVESELALVLSDRASHIGAAGRSVNPYYNTEIPVKRGASGAFIITRLDAYTVAQVLDLINRTGHAMPVNASQSLFVLDQDPLWGTFGGLDEQLATAAGTLSGRGFQTELNTTSTYVTNRSNVLGYTSWGSNDHNFPGSIGPSLPNFQWLPGSIAETYVSTSARSFMPGTAYGQSLIADLLQEGVGGVKGYVFEPYIFAMAKMSIVFDRYTRGYNLADSFAYGSLSLYSWMDVIIGDPKMSILP